MARRCREELAVGVAAAQNLPNPLEKMRKALLSTASNAVEHVRSEAAYANQTEEPVLLPATREQKVLGSAAAPRPAAALSRATVVDAAAAVNALAPFLDLGFAEQLGVCVRVFSLALAHLRVDHQRVEAGRNPLDPAVATLVIVGEALLKLLPSSLEHSRTSP